MEIYLSRNIIEELNLYPGKNIKLSFGIKKVEVSIKELKNITKSFKIPYVFQRLLYLNSIFQQPFSFFLKDDNTLKIGPLIGIMTSQPVVFMKDHLISLYKTIVETGKMLGIPCFLFTSENIEFNNKTVWGFTVGKTTAGELGWVLKQFPIPDIVYNKVGFLISDEAKKAYSRFFLRFLKDNVDVKFFNPFGLGDKWKIYQQLKQYNSIQKYLPDTELLNSTDILESFLNNYKMVYLKPTDSSLSMGVYRITYLSDGDFNIGYRQKEVTLINLSEIYKY
ncbi:MAG: hypothetical protein PWQ82_639 [Thermosediminibacterales bacterium]|nr:hypothetical protein [Thermosediminibacterales bacterium]MDK2835861.1 hypothetical protein [Thermosediminibacterales bacterium]